MQVKVWNEPQTLTARLNQYIHGADVAVVVREIHSKKVYPVASVKQSPIALLSRMTILRVLSDAGGFTEYANGSTSCGPKTLNR